MAADFAFDVRGLAPPPREPRGGWPLTRPLSRSEERSTPRRGEKPGRRPGCFFAFGWSGFCPSATAILKAGVVVMDIFMEREREGIEITITAEWNSRVLPPGWEDLKNTVLTDLRENFLHQDTKGRSALAIAEVMSDAWWKRREAQEGYQVVQELYRYVDERAAREAKKAESTPTRRGSRFSGAPRRAPQPAPEREVSASVIEKPLPPIPLSVEADEAALSVLRQTQQYFFHPETRPPKLFKESPLKEKSKLSLKSIEDYTRLEKQVKKELREQGLSTGWDLSLYLVQTARECSVSTYKKKRAVVMRMMERVSPASVGLIKSLPPYAELCKMLGRTPSRRSTAITEARRAQQNKRTFEKLLSRLTPEHRDAILCLRYTGARCSEGRSLRLEQVPDGIRVSIQTAKTGARKTPGPATRSWVVPLGTEEGDALERILADRGESPVPYSAHALRSAWHRARKKFGLNQDPGWDLHSLRHQYAGELKKQRVAELRGDYGPDWRRHLYGRDWMSSPRYAEDFYGPIAERLGHNCLAMAKIYG